MGLPLATRHCRALPSAQPPDPERSRHRPRTQECRGSPEALPSAGTFELHVFYLITVGNTARCSCGAIRDG